MSDHPGYIEWLKKRERKETWIDDLKREIRDIGWVWFVGVSIYAIPIVLFIYSGSIILVLADVILIVGVILSYIYFDHFRNWPLLLLLLPSQLFMMITARLTFQEILVNRPLLMTGGLLIGLSGFWMIGILSQLRYGGIRRLLRPFFGFLLTGFTLVVLGLMLGI